MNPPINQAQIINPPINPNEDIDIKIGENYKDEDKYIAEEIIDKKERKKNIKEIINNAAEDNPYNKINPNEKKYKIEKKQVVRHPIDQRIFNMIENKINSIKEIQKFILDADKVQINDSEAEFYLELIRSSVYNVKINLSNILNGRCFNYYIGSNTFSKTSSVFTNDRLYWISLLSLNLKSKRIHQYLKLTENCVSLQTICTAQTSGYKKGYVQDYEENFSCIGLETLDKDEINKLKSVDTIKGLDIQTYTYNNIEYGCIVYDTGCIITFKKDEINDLPEKIKRVKIIGNKKNFASEIKLYKLKEGKGVFLSQNVVLTDFFPCEVIVTDELDYSYLFKFNIDMLKFEGYLYKFFDFTLDGGLDSFFRYENLIHWNTFDLMVNFLIVERMTLYKNNYRFEDFRNYIDKFLNDYNEIKREFRNFKLTIEKCLKLIIRFYDSFPTKITYAKVSRFEIPVKDALGKLNTKIKSQIPMKIFNLLTSYGLKRSCNTIFNCVTNNCAIILKIMTEIDSFLTRFKARNGRNLSENLKQIGRDIFNIFNVGGNSYYLTNVMRTPALFLGNLLEDNEDAFLEGMDKINYDYGKERNAHQKELKRIVFFQMGATKDQSIKRCIGLYFIYDNVVSEDDVEMDGNDTDFQGTLNEWYANEFKKSEQYEDDYIKEIRAYGGESIYYNIDDFQELNVDDETMDKLKNLKKLYLNYAKKENLENQIKINENNNLIHNLNIQNENIKKNKKSYLPPNKEVTEEFLQKNGIEIRMRDDDDDYWDFITFTRKKGITDDIVNDNIDSGWIQDFDDAKENDELINSLIQNTQKKWGKHGTAWEDQEEEKIEDKDYNENWGNENINIQNVKEENKEEEKIENIPKVEKKPIFGVIKEPKQKMNAAAKKHLVKQMQRQKEGKKRGLKELLEEANEENKNKKRRRRGKK